MAASATRMSLDEFIEWLATKRGTFSIHHGMIRRSANWCPLQILTNEAIDYISIAKAMGLPVVDIMVAADDWLLNRHNPLRKRMLEALGLNEICGGITGISVSLL